MVGASGTIRNTTNGGSNWNAQTSGTGNDLRGISFVDANNGWAVGASGTILNTTNGGSTWSAQTSGTSELLRGVSFVDANTGWAVGHSGTIVKHSTPLPVELTYFKGEAIAEGSLLEWETVTETNNKGFEIQRSKDLNEQKWETIDFVQGNGITLETKNYTYIDQNPLDGKNYYRLKQVDFDGAYEYSDVVEVKHEVRNKIFRVFPNPATNYVVVDGIETGEMVQVFNVYGQLVKEFQSTSNRQQISINDLSNGTYYVRMENQVKKLTIQK